MNPIAGTLVARRFRLVRELGRGSMGTVWLADHESLGLRCAVKFMTAEAEGDPAYRERFEREARSVAQLDCPNVVRILDYDVFEGVPFLAMESLSGEDLESRLRRVGRLGVGDVHKIVTQIAQGLERAHAAGIIHRDLKPGNVFLARTDDGEVAKILDFGLAKVTSYEGVEAMTQAGSVLGTPVYMSPEQARSVSEVDERSDLWSLAVIAYECLLGKLPFDGPSLGEVFARIMFEPIPVPSEIDPQVPRGFDRWWQRAVSRDVERRFTSAREMADALGRALGLEDGHSSRNDLASVHTVPPPSRASAPPARKRGVPWLGLTALTTLVVAGSHFWPNLPHGVVPASVSGPVRSASRAAAQSLSRLAAQAEAALPAEPSTFVAPPASSASAPNGPVSPIPTAAVVLPPIPPESPVTPMISVPPPPPSHGAPASPDPTSTSDKAEVDELAASGLECRTGQHRCDGRVLEVCNDARDGWAAVVECPEGASCDATGSGRCTPRVGVESDEPNGPSPGF
jgi:serine/threonine protein kinase